MSDHGLMGNVPSSAKVAPQVLSSSEHWLLRARSSAKSAIQVLDKFISKLTHNCKNRKSCETTCKGPVINSNIAGIASNNAKKINCIPIKLSITT